MLVHSKERITIRTAPNALSHCTLVTIQLDGISVFCVLITYRIFIEDLERGRCSNSNWSAKLSTVSWNAQSHLLSTFNTSCPVCVTKLIINCGGMPQVPFWEKRVNINFRKHNYESIQILFWEKNTILQLFTILYPIKIRGHLPKYLAYIEVPRNWKSKL